MEHIHIDQGIINLQNKIGLNQDFFKNLLNEEDWSFVIKLHALIEALMTSLLVFHFNEQKLANIFSRLELSNKTTGKIAFIKEIGLLGENDLKYINTLSELRNKFVHNVENCNISLVDWLNTIDKNQLKNFATYMRPFEASMRDFAESGLMSKLDPNLKRQSEIASLIKFAREKPKTHIWLGAYSLLTNVADSYFYSDYLQSEKAKLYYENDREIFG